MTLEEKSIPEVWIDFRWEELPSGLTRCKIHDTVFNKEIEPCWQCYKEAQVGFHCCLFCKSYNDSTRQCNRGHEIPNVRLHSCEEWRYVA